MNKNWFFIILLTISSLSLAGTAAYFSIFGLAKLFYGAGLGIIVLATVLEFSKLVAVSYVYRYWKHIAKALRFYYIFGVVFIMLLTSLGIYGFLTSAYQNTANKVEIRDSQIKIAENKKTLFVNQLDRMNKNIESSNNRINKISEIRNQQEQRLNSLYDKNSVTSARRTESQITSSDDQIKMLNTDITEKMKQSNIINDSISYYDQKIIELKSSDVSSEIGPLKYLSELTGYSMNVVVNILVLLIIFVFDPMAITLLIGVNQLSMLDKNNNTNEPQNRENKKNITTPKYSRLLKKRKKNPNNNLNTNLNNITTSNNKIQITENQLDEDDFMYNNDQDVNLVEGVDEVILDKNDSDIIDDAKNIINDDLVLNDDEYDDEFLNIESKGIQKDMVVYHDVFGKGKVIKTDLERDRIFIEFQDGVKELSSEYANLKVIKKIPKQVKLDNIVKDDKISNIEATEIIKGEDIVQDIKDDEDPYEEVVINKKWIDSNTPWIVREKSEKVKRLKSK